MGTLNEMRDSVSGVLVTRVSPYRTAVDFLAGAVEQARIVIDRHQERLVPSVIFRLAVTECAIRKVS